MQKRMKANKQKLCYALVTYEIDGKWINLCILG